MLLNEAMKRYAFTKMQNIVFVPVRDTLYINLNPEKNIDFVIAGHKKMQTTAIKKRNLRF